MEINPGLMFIVEAGDRDHVQGAPDHPQVLIQYNGFLKTGARFLRLNPDKYYVEQVIGGSFGEQSVLMNSFFWICGTKMQKYAEIFQKGAFDTSILINSEVWKTF